MPVPGVIRCPIPQYGGQPFDIEGIGVAHLRKPLRNPGVETSYGIPLTWTASAVEDAPGWPDRQLEIANDNQRATVSGDTFCQAQYPGLQAIQDRFQRPIVKVGEAVYQLRCHTFQIQENQDCVRVLPVKRTVPIQYQGFNLA